MQQEPARTFSKVSQIAVCHHCFKKLETKTVRRKSDKLLHFIVASLFFPPCILVVLCILLNEDYYDIYHACPECSSVIFKRTGIDCTCNPPIEKLYKTEAKIKKKKIFAIEQDSRLNLLKKKK